MGITIFGATDAPTEEIPAGHERVSLVTDDATGAGYYQVERADGDFYLCDADGDKVRLASWTLQRVLADVPADDADAFFAAVGATAKRID